MEYDNVILEWFKINARMESQINFCATLNLGFVYSQIIEQNKYSLKIGNKIHSRSIQRSQWWVRL